MTEPLIIDVHMHVYPSKEEGQQAVQAYEGWEFGDRNAHAPYSRYAGDLADALDAMDEAGVSRAVMVHLFRPLRYRSDKIVQLPKSLSNAQREGAIHDIDSELANALKESNVWACNLVKDQTRMVPFISIDPHVLSPHEAVGHLREMVQRHGARGIKLHSVIQRFFMGDRRMWPIYQACVELDIAIIAHSGSARGTDQYGEPRAFAEVFKTFPQLKLVMAHMGNGSWRQTREIAEACPNAVFDCSEVMEWPGAPNAPTDQELAQLIKDIGPNRVLLGSDFPWWSPAHCVERLMGLPVLSREEKESILGANAVRILGL
jgi:predicted TIM-barrel fold metal-dependent hydrolase